MTLLEAMKALQVDRRNEAAWESLFRLLWPRVFGVLYRGLAGDRERARDGAQEVFLRLARYLPIDQIQNEDALRAYVYVVARRVAAQEARREGQPQPQTDVIELLSDPTSPGPLRMSAVREALQHVFGSLTGVDRQILLLRLKGHSLEEIGAMTDRSASSVATRLHRLRTRLRRELAAREKS